jgi:cell wall-associated NlpC family hydrolase
MLTATLKKLRVILLLTMLGIGCMASMTLAYGQATSLSPTSPRSNSTLPTTTAGWEEFMNTPVAPSEKNSPPATASERVNDMIIYALSHLGIRYKYGAENPEKEFDCSGLVRWVFNRSWGIMLPRRSVEIAKEGKAVSRDELKPGDLVFFNTLKRAYSHVGIYLGDGRFLHAPSAGGQVRVEDINIPYWQQRWNGARRINPSAADKP